MRIDSIGSVTDTIITRITGKIPYVQHISGDSSSMTIGCFLARFYRDSRDDGDISAYHLQQTDKNGSVFKRIRIH